MRKQRAERLRFAVESLPPETQRAMLKGIKENRIVTGANTDRRGGVCPMLAADRNAFAVTPLAEIFATAWDQYTGTSFVNVNRRAASERDLRVLQTMLETSLKLSARAGLPAPVAAPPAVPQPAAPELAQVQATLTAAARIEVIRALEASGHHVPTRPAPRAAAAPSVPVPAEAPVPWGRVRRETRPLAGAPPTRPAAPAPRVRATGADRRPPALKTETELERQRARAIIANQASTLRSRAWPRPADPARPVETTGPGEAARRFEAARQIEAGRPVEAAPTPVPTPVVRVGRPSRMQELAARSGWAWLPAFNSYDDYERTLEELGETQRGPGADDGGVRREDTKQPDRTPA